MVNPTVIQAVHVLLQQRGIQQHSAERLGDYVARGLRISPSQAEVLLEALDRGCSIEAAQREAGIFVQGDEESLLVEIARAIGSALGRIGPHATPTQQK